jgi:protein-disulfide isomerase
MLRAILALFAALVLTAAPAQAQQRKPAAKPNWLATVQQTPEGGYRQGNPNAPVKLIEYGSRSCPTCRRFHEEGAGPLRTKYIATGRVSWEYRDFPVHPQDIANILLGRCVAPASYFRVLDAMYAEQAAFEARAGQMTIGEIQRIQGLQPFEATGAWAQGYGYVAFMQRFGVTPARANACMTSVPALQALAGQIEAGDKAGVDGTPTFFINGRKPDHAHSWAELEPLLKAAGA